MHPASQFKKLGSGLSPDPIITVAYLSLILLRKSSLRWCLFQFPLDGTQFQSGTFGFFANRHPSAQRSFFRLLRPLLIFPFFVFIPHGPFGLSQTVAALLGEANAAVSAFFQPDAFGIVEAFGTFRDFRGGFAPAFHHGLVKWSLSMCPMNSSSLKCSHRPILPSGRMVTDRPLSAMQWFSR